VRHSQIFILRLGVDRERQIVRPIQNLQLARNELDIACDEIRIFSAGRPRGDSTRDLDYILATQSVRDFCELGVFLGPKNNLDQAFAIAKINENNTAVIARDIYPPGKRDFLADIAFAK
jgi:hypothetical protein